MPNISIALSLKHISCSTVNTACYGHILAAGFAVVGDVVGHFNVRFVDCILNNALYLRVEMVCLLVR